MKDLNGKDMKRNILSAQIDVSKFSSADFEKATDEEKKQVEARVKHEEFTFYLLKLVENISYMTMK